MLTSHICSCIIRRSFSKSSATCNSHSIQSHTNITTAGFNVHSTHYRSFKGRFYRSDDPTNIIIIIIIIKEQIKVT